MSLRTRIVWYLLAIVAVFAVGSYALQRTTFFKAFGDLETGHAREDVRRVLSALEREEEHLSARCTDLAQWNEMYRYALERDPRWAADNLTREYVLRNRLNLLLVCDKRGKVVTGQSVDQAGAALKMR